MMRGGPKQRYSGGHNGPADKKSSLAQESSGSDASSDSESEDEQPIETKKHQSLP